MIVIGNYTQKKMKIKCYNCNKEWEYKGKNKHNATCPDCLRKVKIEKKKK